MLEPPPFTGVLYTTIKSQVAQIQVQFQQDMGTLDAHHTRLVEGKIQTGWGINRHEDLSAECFWRNYMNCAD